MPSLIDLSYQIGVGRAKGNDQWRPLCHLSESELSRLTRGPQVSVNLLASTLVRTLESSVSAKEAVTIATAVRKENYRVLKDDDEDYVLVHIRVLLGTQKKGAEVWFNSAFSVAKSSIFVRQFIGGVTDVKV